jgi:hypothetical protein
MRTPSSTCVLQKTAPVPSGLAIAKTVSRFGCDPRDHPAKASLLELA